MTLILVGIFIYQTASNRKTQTTTSTGAIPLEDVKSRQALTEAIKLSSGGVYTAQEFSIIPGKGAKFTIELKSPAIESRRTFDAWLQANGYSHIRPENFSYIEVQ